MTDVEVALMALLDRGNFGYTVTSDPPDLEAKLDEFGAVIRISRDGGAGDREHDFPAVTIQVKAVTAPGDTERAHIDIASDIEAFLFKEIPGAWVDGVVFEDVRKDSGPLTRRDNPSTAYRAAETRYSFRTSR